MPDLSLIFLYLMLPFETDLILFNTLHVVLYKYLFVALLCCLCTRFSVTTF